MKLLGFYLGAHDSNLALYDQHKLRYFKSERILQFKHHRANLEWVKTTCQAANFIPDAVAFSDGNRNDLGLCDPERTDQAVKPLPCFGKIIPTFCVDHHYAHILSSWPITSIPDVDFGVAMDGRGDHGRRITIIRSPGLSEPTPVLISQDRRYCRFLNLIGQRLGLRGLAVDFAGKVMGAHAYGEIDQDFVHLHRNGIAKDNPLLLLDRIAWRGKSPPEHNQFFDFNSGCFRDWLASVHRLIGYYIEDTFAEYIPPDAAVVYSGGGAQNSVINEYLFQAYPKLIVPPHCYDGGLSLGCLEFLRKRFQLPEFKIAGFPFWQNDPHGGFAKSSTIERVADHLANGKIVGWFQGKGEIGPRALGHRSILFDARRSIAKDYLNRTVKRREKWRPYAGSILASTSQAVLMKPSLSPFMLRAMHIQTEIQEEIPAVVHIDGTCRIQTVQHDDFEIESFANLIACVTQNTGAAAILNTSLNADGSPIVSTPEQALDLWRATPMDVLCIGDKIYEKQ